MDSLKNTLRAVCATVCVVTLAYGFPRTGIAADPPGTTRLLVGLQSTDQVLNDLEYLVAKLAGKKKSYEDNVAPNIDIFAIGVARDRVVRFDSIMDPEHGRQIQTIVPIEDLNEFLNDNLDPIGITPVKQRTDKNLLELEGTVYQGWLRYLAEPAPYAVIFPQMESMPKAMDHPAKAHEALAKEGWLTFLELRNDAKGMESRKAAFVKMRAEALKDFQKKPEESREEFELRRRMREHTLTILEQWLVESRNAMLGLKVDQEGHQAPSRVKFSALPETGLARAIERVGEPNLYSSIPVPADPVLSIRGNIPIDESHQAAYREIYALARPVAKQRIDELEKASAAEKAARQEVSSLFLDVLEASIGLGVVNGFLDVEGKGDAHTLVMAITCAGQDKIIQLIEKLPAAKSGWSLEKDVDKAAGTSIHRIGLGETLPKSITTFYGSSAAAHVAVTDKAFWLGFGADGLATLKARMETAAAQPPQTDNVMLAIKMHARPVLKNVYEFSNESDLEIVDAFRSRGTFRGAETRNARTGQDGERRRAASALADFKWQETAIAAMDGLDDRFEFKLDKVGEGEIGGGGNAQKGFLTAVGAVIAKFADENLR